MNQSPRPGPICSSRLRAMPSPDLFGAILRSMSCASRRAGKGRNGARQEDHQTTAPGHVGLLLR